MLKLSESFEALNQMTIRQLANTLNQIRCAEHISFISGSLRHLIWLIRRVFGFFPVELKISRSRLHVGEHNAVATLVNSMDAYDFNNMNAIKLLLAHYRDGVFFDIGANIGTYTLVASEVPSAKVVNFEPHPETYEQLKSNVALNVRTNVMLMNIALSNHDGDVILTDYRTSLSSINKVVEDSVDPEGNFIVTSKTIDSVCNQLCLRPNIVKIDTEGHEFKVLSGFKMSIHGADVLLIENGEEDNIKHYLKTLGFYGPLYINVSKRRFLSVAQKRKEDPVYIRKTFGKRLRQLGFLLPQN